MPDTAKKSNCSFFRRVTAFALPCQSSASSLAATLRKHASEEGTFLMKALIRWFFGRRAILFYMLLLGVREGYGNGCRDLLERAPNDSVVNYRLNYDRAIQRIKYLAQKYRGELALKKVFSYDGEEVLRIEMPAHTPRPQKRVIMTAGVHGNESITTETLIEVIEDLIGDSNMRSIYDFVFYPLMNTGGLKNNSRYLNNGVDLNRTFQKGHEDRFTELFIESLGNENFDLAIDLHEAYKRPGFFIIKSGEGEDYLSSVLSEIDSAYLFQSPNGVYPYDVKKGGNSLEMSYILEAKGIAISGNKGTLKSYFEDERNIPASYTLESSGAIELEQRKRIYKQLIMGLLKKFHTRP